MYKNSIQWKCNNSLILFVLYRAHYTKNNVSIKKVLFNKIKKCLWKGSSLCVINENVLYIDRIILLIVWKSFNYGIY